MILLTEENQNGRVKIKIDLEINQPLMEIMKESMETLPAALQMLEQKTKE